MTALKTIETNLAAALMVRGARLKGWEKSPDGRKLYWQLEEVNPQWFDDYRTGADGVAAVMRNRSILINICMTELPAKQGNVA